MTEEKTQKTGEKQEKQAKAEKGKVEKSKKSAPKKAKSKRRSVVAGNAYVHAGFNNTIITLTDTAGETIAWSSAGSCGFKGARKSTPYAAQVAAETATGKAKIFGLEKVNVYVRGIGPGREQAIRGLHIAGLSLETITDLTPIPHNGCRQKKARRV
ncbi:MAG: 30S ribosomal protein S11 [Candidatus Gracilibacteria bacterium]|jgi:small subunit ribosomal protein S11